MSFSNYQQYTRQINEKKFVLTAPFTATSRSASSKTMQGAFPPSSKETCKNIVLKTKKVVFETSTAFRL